MEQRYFNKLRTELNQQQSIPIRSFLPNDEATLQVRSFQVDKMCISSAFLKENDLKFFALALGPLFKIVSYFTSSVSISFVKDMKSFDFILSGTEY